MGWVFLEKNEIVIFLENTQHCFAYISATKYCSEAILYSKRTAGYPLSPHIKTIAVAFLGSVPASLHGFWFSPLGNLLVCPRLAWPISYSGATNK